MSLGVMVESLSEIWAQAVRFRIQEGLYKIIAFNIVQVNPDLAEFSLKLVENRLEWVALPLPTQGHFLWPIGSQDHDPGASQPAAEMEEQVDGAAIGPLEVIE
jgi:hypothetical protein